MPSKLKFSATLRRAEISREVWQQQRKYDGRSVTYSPQIHLGSWREVVNCSLQNAVVLRWLEKQLGTTRLPSPVSSVFRYCSLVCTTLKNSLKNSVKNSVKHITLRSCAWSSSLKQVATPPPAIFPRFFLDPWKYPGILPKFRFHIKSFCHGKTKLCQVTDVHGSPLTLADTIVRWQLRLLLARRLTLAW